MPNKNKNKTKTSKKNTNRPQKAKKTQSSTEMSLGRALLRGLGGLGGGAAGLFTGGPSNIMRGANAGYAMGNKAATVLGMGAYSVSSNSLYDHTIKNGQVPNMHSAGQSIVVRHKEYIGDIVSSGNAGAFNSVSYPINPGLPASFPWLSGIADQFQEYTFKGLLYEFKSSSADAIASSTNTALGTVILTTRYNPLLPAPQGKIDALNEYFTSDAKPSEDFCHFIECDPRENPFNVQYIRDGPPPAGSNVQNYDLGELYACTQGMQGTNNICGELWASYEVELRKPIITDNLVLSSYGQFSSTSTVGISTSNYFGTSQINSIQNLPGCTVFLTSNTINISGPYQGTFMVLYYLKGTSGAWVAPVVSAGLNCVATTEFANNTASNLYVPAGAGNVSYNILGLYTFSYSNTSAVANTMTVNFSGGTFVTPTVAETWVIPVSSNAI